MHTIEWPDLLTIVQSVLNNAPSPLRGNICPITDFLGRAPTMPTSTFIRTYTVKPVLLSDAVKERALNIEEFIKARDELHPLFQSTFVKYHEQARAAASRAELPNFTDRDFVLVARTEFGAEDKHLIRWRGPRRVIKPINDFVYTFEDLRTGQFDDIHASRLKLFRDDDINKEAILSHVLHSEGGMSVQRLMGLEETEDGLYILVR